MKTIGLLGGTGWSSTIDYYTQLNMLVGARLGGYHSAQILLKSIDYETIMTHYGKDDGAVAAQLQNELKGLLGLPIDCFMICCNSLHKYFDLIKENLDIQIPMFHALDLTAQHMKAQGFQTALLLATKFTMEDGFFARRLESHGLQVIVPSLAERDAIGTIHAALMRNTVTPESRAYFEALISKYATEHPELDAVILGCTELPLAITPERSVLPLIDPVRLQTSAAISYAL